MFWVSFEQQFEIVAVHDFAKSFPKLAHAFPCLLYSDYYALAHFSRGLVHLVYELSGGFLVEFIHASLFLDLSGHGMSLRRIG
jgi:hypothetical protein